MVRVGVVVAAAAVGAVAVVWYLVGGSGAPALPGCSRATARAPQLSDVASTSVVTSAQPFGVVATGDRALVALGGFTGSTGVGVYELRGGLPRLVHTIPLTLSTATGETLTSDGRYLLVAGDSGAAVVDVRREKVLGTLSLPAALTTPRRLSAIEVALTRDDRYAFVSLEYSGEIAVFDLRTALASRFRRQAFVGLVPVGRVVVGLALSPDGRRLYATSSYPFPLSFTHEGALVAIDVGRAERRPTTAVLTRVVAGCGPARIEVTPDGRTVWVTARESNALLGFSTSRLSLVAAVRVGEAPVGLVLYDAGRRALVLDSNRLGLLGKSSDLAVVDTGRRKLLATLAAGVFPREAAITPDGSTLLVTVFGSAELEAIRTRDLP